MSLPSISVVTPSYNQAPFLQACIDSVCSQGYPALDYSVVDGGSMDGSVDIIRANSARLDYWVSESDKGQAHAINKGLSRFTGDVWGFLNSDDELEPGCLARVGRLFADNRDLDAVFGDCTFIDKYGRIRGKGAARPFDRAALLEGCYIFQPSMFLRRRVLDEFGLFDESLHFVFDYEYWLRVSSRATLHYFPEVLSRYRIHGATKSALQPETMAEEALAVRLRYGTRADACRSYRRFHAWGKWKHLTQVLAFEVGTEIYKMIDDISRRP